MLDTHSGMSKSCWAYAGVKTVIIEDGPAYTLTDTLFNTKRDVFDSFTGFMLVKAVRWSSLCRKKPLNYTVRY